MSPSAWSKAVVDRDIEAVVSFVAGDIYMPLCHAPSKTGIGAVREWVTKTMALAEGFDWRWQAKKVEVSRDGTMAYVAGNYQLSLKAKDGKQIADHARYLTVWRKSADGKGKAAVDTSNTDLSPDEYSAFFAVFAAAFTASS